MRRAPILCSAAAAAILGCAAMAVGQDAHNAPNARNAPYPQQPVPQAKAAQGGQPVDTRVNRELYGNDTATNVPLYGPQFEPLPSETLIATQRSGVLPSELQMNAAAIGPLAPYGSASYIPGESALQRVNRVRPPALWGPAYVGQRLPQPTGTPSPEPAPSVQQNVIPGERHNGAPPSAQYIEPPMIQPQILPGGYRLSADPSAFNHQSVTTYRVLPRTRLPTTQPAATQPSLGDFQR